MGSASTQVGEFQRLVQALYDLYCDGRYRRWDEKATVSGFARRAGLERSTVDKALSGERAPLLYETTKALIDGLYRDGQGVLRRDEWQWFKQKLHAARMAEELIEKYADLLPPGVSVSDETKSEIWLMVERDCRQRIDLFAIEGVVLAAIARRLFGDEAVFDETPSHVGEHIASETTDTFDNEWIGWVRVNGLRIEDAKRVGAQSSITRGECLQEQAVVLRNRGTFVPMGLPMMRDFDFSVTFAPPTGASTVRHVGVMLYNDAAFRIMNGEPPSTLNGETPSQHLIGIIPERQIVYSERRSTVEDVSWRGIHHSKIVRTAHAEGFLMPSRVGSGRNSKVNVDDNNTLEISKHGYAVGGTVNGYGPALAICFGHNSPFGDHEDERFGIGMFFEHVSTQPIEQVVESYSVTPRPDILAAALHAAQERKIRRADGLESGASGTSFESRLGRRRAKRPDWCPD